MWSQRLFQDVSNRESDKGPKYTKFCSGGPVVSRSASQPPGHSRRGRGDLNQIMLPRGSRTSNSDPSTYEYEILAPFATLLVNDDSCQVRSHPSFTWSPDVGRSRLSGVPASFSLTATPVYQ